MTDNDDKSQNENAKLIKWINDEVGQSEALSKFEDFATDAIAKLEHDFYENMSSIRKSSKSTNAKIESIAYKFSESSQQLNDHIATLDDIEQDVKEASLKLARLLEDIQLTDVERNNLSAALVLISSFKEWIRLIRELKATLYSFPGKHEQICRLFDLLQSVLANLSSQPGHTQRIEQLNRAREEWKTCLRPHFVELFQGTDFQIMKEEIDCFKEIGLADFAIEVFTDCRKAEFLTDQPFNFLAAKSLMEAGERYLNCISDSIALWIEYCRMVFDSPLPLMRQVNTLLSLRLEALCRIEKMADIDDVTRFKQRCDRFVSEMANICSLYSIPKSDEYALGQCFLSMACLLNGIVVNRVQSYIDYETEELDKLDIFLSPISEVDIDQTPVVSKALNKFVEHYQKSSERCKELTNDMLICQYIQLFQRFILKFLKFMDDLVAQASATHLDATENIVPVAGEQFLKFRLAINLMTVVGNLIETIDDFEAAVTLRLDEASRPPAVEDGISLFAVKNAGRQLFVDLEEFNNDCERLRSVKHERGTYFPIVSRSLDNMCEVLMQFAINSLISPVEPKLKAYCEREILGTANRNKSLVNGLPSYSIYPSQTVSEATKHILVLAQTLDQYLPEKNKRLLQVFSRTSAIRCRKDDRQINHTDDVGIICVEQTCISIVERILSELCQLDFNVLDVEAYRQIVTDLEHMQAILDNVGISSQCPLRLLLDCIHEEEDSHRLLSVDLPSLLQKLCSNLRKVSSRQQQFDSVTSILPS